MEYTRILITYTNVGILNIFWNCMMIFRYISYRTISPYKDFIRLYPYIWLKPALSFITSNFKIVWRVASGVRELHLRNHVRFIDLPNLIFGISPKVSEEILFYLFQKLLANNTKLAKLEIFSRKLKYSLKTWNIHSKLKIFAQEKSNFSYIQNTFLVIVY